MLNSKNEFWWQFELLYFSLIDTFKELNTFLKLKVETDNLLKIGKWKSQKIFSLAR
jgi:hypothetical protein